MRKGHSTLLTNHKGIIYANQWYLNIGYAERALLVELGKDLDIEALIDIDSFLVEQNTMLHLNQKLLELGPSPYSNIKEIARKLPECFSGLYLSTLKDMDQARFDQDFFQLFDLLAIEMRKPNRSFLEIFTQLPYSGLKACVERFNAFVKSESQMAKQLHFVTQVMFQTVFSSGLNELETSYLLLSLISPRFKVEGDALAAELLYEYRKLGGDLRDAVVCDWGVRDTNLEYVLLDTIDGNIKVDHTYFFSQNSHQLPFESVMEKTPFNSIVVECQIEHDFINFFKNKRVVFAPKNRMGSDFPYWEFSIDENGSLVGIYSYADYQGTKPSFYYPSALDDLYDSLKVILPGLDKSDWISRARLRKGKDIWFEFSPQYKDKLSPDNKRVVEQFKSIHLREGNEPLRGISHCGPDRGRSLGLYAYLVDIFSS